mgnify:CR=1 FL=1
MIANKMKIDEKDIVLIRELVENGRKSLIELGKKLKMTHAAVRARLKRLENEGYIKVQANVNPERLNIKTLYVFLKAKELRKAVEYLMKLSKNCRCIVQVSILSSNYNLLVVLAGRNYEELRGMIERKLRHANYMEIAEVVLGSIIFPEYIPINTTAVCEENCSACELSKIYKAGCPAPLR